MDPLTHALASYTLKRAAFPRAPRPTTIAILIAGTIADLDSLSKFAGPSAFLTFYRTYFHSLFAALFLSLLVILPFLLRKREPTEIQTSPLPTFAAALAASVLHLLMDLSQSAGVELFWPFSTRRFALDWLPHLDLWIFGILLAGILLPMLSRLVTEEIGAKSKGPRGKLGASLALATMILYLVLRFVLHGNALAALESRTYRGESPRMAAAFPESGSPFRWHGIVDTASALTTSKSKSASPPRLTPTPPPLPTNPNPPLPSTPPATPPLRAASSRSRASPKPPSRKPPMAFISPCAPSPTLATLAPAYASTP